MQINGASGNLKDGNWFLNQTVKRKVMRVGLLLETKKKMENIVKKLIMIQKNSVSLRDTLSSCRSTMFLVFICMACCVVTGLLQVYFQGYLAGIALCAGLFLISFIVFCMYGRMLRKSRRGLRELKSKLRIA